MSKSGVIWTIILVAAVAGITLKITLMPQHKKVFWKNFIKQIPHLPGRMLA